VKTGSTNSAAADHPILVRIHMLAGLRDHGVITLQEYEAKRADLLSKVVSAVCRLTPAEPGPQARGRSHR
jgi:hypothetical protein